MRFVAILLLLLSSAAAAAECGNCRGQRVVGPGVVKMPCPICDGTGEVPEAAKRPHPAVCRVIATHDGNKAHGSGVLVRVSGAKGLVLTNDHVVADRSGGVHVAWPDGSGSAAKVVAIDRTWDLAALVVDKPGATPVSLASGNAKVGDVLTIAGYGSGEYREQRGAVTQYLSPVRMSAYHWVEIEASARKGDSGGPMLNASGELAGVLWGQGGGLTAGSCASKVRQFLKEVPFP